MSTSFHPALIQALSQLEQVDKVLESLGISDPVKQYKVLKAIDSRVKHHEFVNGQHDACLAILEADLKKKKKAREEATAEREKQLLE